MESGWNRKDRRRRIMSTGKDTPRREKRIRRLEFKLLRLEQNRQRRFIGIRYYNFAKHRLNKALKKEYKSK